MLKFYETFQKYIVPKDLVDEIYDINEKKLEAIDRFSKVNIFIGPNNSGKSKLIRELIREMPIPYYGAETWKTITDIIEKIFSVVHNSLSEVYESNNYFIISNSGNGEIINTEEVFKTKERLIQNSPNYDISNTINTLENWFINLPANIKRDTSFYIRGVNSSTITLDEAKKQKFFEKYDEIKFNVTPLIEELKKFKFASFTQKDISRIYIPSMRTLRSFAAEANIRDQTKKEYQFSADVVIYNGQDFPNEVADLTNSEYINRQKLIQFQELLSKEFFESKPVKLTYHNRNKVLLIKIGDENEKPIHELGDGLQMIIILTFPFFANDTGLIAIEEPELFIHPGLQKTFIKFLISNSKTENFQIFIATHSNHIIDSINQSNLVSLFSVRKKEKQQNKSIEKVPDFVIENLSFGNENFLNLLGITNTSVYLSNCTIWVEGITDKLYVQKFIFEYLKSIDQNSKYSICKQFIEGINYSFALTGGDSIIHWDFSDESEYFENTKNIIVRRFCSKSLVIVDNDFGKNAKRKKLLKELLRERFIELESPEVENLLSPAVINSTLMSYPSVIKTVCDNKLPLIDRNVFQSKKIGYIIDKLILKEYPSTKSFSANKNENSSLKSGDKFIFCNKALTYITFENL
ncbi:MAG: ATP-binding protein, partial [Panacibacter sp.]